MKLYVCGAGTRFGLLRHPCGRAARALEQAGHAFEVEQVPGFKNVPGSLRPGMRDHIVELTGSTHVPVLVLDDGAVVSGSQQIVEWARAHPSASA